MPLNDLSLDQLIRSYLICGATEGKSQKTTDWYSANLWRFSQFLKDNNHYNPVPGIGTAEARAFISHLQNGVKRWEKSPFIRDNNPLSPFSVQGYSRSIKALWSWLTSEGYIQHNPMLMLYYSIYNYHPF